MTTTVKFFRKKTDSDLIITYLLNSGFLVEGKNFALVFDLYLDPTRELSKFLHETSEKKSLYFFVSHAHGDHFNRTLLAQFENAAKNFFVDISVPFKNAKTIALKNYSSFENETLRVTTFSSTDEGTSFLVEIDNFKIFHAGDFNWWHWFGDTHDNNGFARNGFFKQLKRMQNLTADVAFFPIDGRLGAANTWGAKEFIHAAKISSLIGMHNVGFARFIPNENFFENMQPIPVWSPVQPSEKIFVQVKKNF